MSTETIWDKIIEETVELHRDSLDINHPNFKSKFQTRFLYNVQDWFLKIFNFVENDQVKANIWDTKEKLDFEDEEESLISAIDQRKHNIFKNVINWKHVIALFNDEEESDEEDGDDDRKDSEESDDDVSEVGDSEEVDNK